MLYEFLKRCIDIFGSLVGLVIFSPVIVFSALLIKVTSEGSFFVEHSDRVGQDERVFRMLKFRTMVKNSHKLLRTDPKYKKLLEQYKQNSFKLVNDPRVTPLGKFLRRTSIDELPQFFNVLTGQMSLVGPRAYYPDELVEQKKKFPNCKDFIKEALAVKPGMTGLWQVSGRSEVGFEKRIEMDSSYAQRKSLLLDLLILCKTPMAVVRGEGKNTAK